MLSLNAIQRQMKKLQSQASKLESRETKTVIKQITRLMQKHDISIAELRGLPGGRSRKGKGASPLAGRKVKAMYRNPKTGETWSGRGRTTRWMAEAEKAGQKREQFLIKKK